MFSIPVRKSCCTVVEAICPVFSKRRFTVFALVAVLAIGTTLLSQTAEGVEGENPTHPEHAAQPTYGRDQRLHVAGLDSAGTYAKLPDRIDVFFRGLEFNLVPSSLELWINELEYTESLRFWVDRAWLELPPDFQWNNGSNRVIARIRDGDSITHEETTEFFLRAPPPGGHPWPFEPTNEPHVVSNLMEDWQDFTFTPTGQIGNCVPRNALGMGSPESPPYWHRGLDIRADAGDDVYAVVAGTVVKIDHYGGGPAFWSVGIRDTDGYVWQYHHLDPTTIIVDEGDVVNQGDALGQIISWSVNLTNQSGTHPYHHLHLNVVTWEGPGPVQGPYRDGFRYHNPLLFLTKGTYNDIVVPALPCDVWFADNESSSPFAADSDPVPPNLSGDVDIITRMRENMTIIPGIAGQPYELGLYEIAWGAIPMDTECRLAWVPRTLLYRFDQVPGGKGSPPYPAGTLIASQEEVLKQVFQEETIHYEGSDYQTEFTYDNQEMYYTVTNGFFGTIDDGRGYWNTDLVTPLGVHFPDGTYQVNIYAKDYYANEHITSVDVEVSNGLVFTGFCPDDIVAGFIGGSIHLDAFTGPGPITVPGSFPITFGNPMEGSVRAMIPYGDWPSWEFGFPSEGFTVNVGVLAGNHVDVEYVPLLGDVILEVPAEVQVRPDSVGGGFDPHAPSTSPVDLRLSTRLARDPWTGQARIGHPHELGMPEFGLVMAREIDVNGEAMLLRTDDNGSHAEWLLESVAVSPQPTPATVPSRLMLQAGPNPFGSALSVTVTQPADGTLAVNILDVQGRVLRVLHDGHRSVGESHYTWDGRNRAGVEQPPGVYFVVARGHGAVVSRKIVRTQ